jgi:predicted transglutaminase-like cysteine proteinase
MARREFEAMNKLIRMLAVSAVAVILPQVASAGVFNAPKQPFDVPMAGKVNTKSYTLGPAGFYVMCSTMPSACKVQRARNVGTAAGAIKLTVDTLSLVDRVNRQINGSMRPQAEAGNADVWKIGGSTGDCEDYALIKRAALLRNGFPSSSLLMTSVITGRGESHAVLMVRTDRGDFVLDNLSPRVKPWSATGYRFISMQSPDNPRMWVRL